MYRLHADKFAAPMECATRLITRAVKNKPMDAAVAALDFETAARLRDEISILRATAADAPVDTRGLTRQRPGAMGLGTSQARPVRPEGWVPPKKPDPMTRGRGRGQR